jgi:hypothetical protein
MTASGPPQAPTLDPAGTGTWSLGLFTCPIGMKPDSSAMLINIADPHSLGGILPVFSAPISFSPSNAAQTRRKVSKSNTKKQDEIQRIYIVPGHNYNSHVQVTEPISKLILSPDERTYRSVVITEKTSPDLDKVVGNLFFHLPYTLTMHVFPLPFGIESLGLGPQLLVMVGTPCEDVFSTSTHPPRQRTN